MCLAGLGDCLAPSHTVWESPAGAPPVLETVWQRFRLSGSFLQVPKRSGRLSGTAADNQSGVSCRCPAGIGASGTVADCLKYSYKCLDGLGTVPDCLGVSCRCPVGLGDCLVPAQTVWESPAGAPNPIWVTARYRHKLSGNLLQEIRRSWHRHRLSGSLVQVPRQSGGLLAPSQTVWESPAGAQTVWDTVWNRRRLSGSLLSIMATINEAHIRRKLGLQETPRQSATVTKSLPDRLGKSMRLQESPMTNHSLNCVLYNGEIIVPNIPWVNPS
ncbi:hypothetical protein DPMN_098894 [Dreissena polymorpha]|uniref:Uncharacterized protein n=1 Tax=Dreissena polymorpha TaxID=45954 RepID=A0A9D4LEL7_DREPO|nr:hypothetical protein DPMN_098894 [Dreissena polymorpha]